MISLLVKPFLWLKYNWLVVLDIGKTIMLGVLLIMGITLLSHTANQTQQIKKLSGQNNSLAAQNKDLSVQLTHSNKDIKSHIDCIITFFGLPNRQDLKISDVCHFQPVSATDSTSGQSASGPLTVQRSSSGVSGPLSVSSSSTQSAPTPIKSQRNSSQAKPSQSVLQKLFNIPNGLLKKNGL